MQKMQFRIKKINVTISFTFFALILLIVVFRKSELLYLTCIFAILHEIGHLIALRKAGVIITGFKISCFGANIKTENFKKIKAKEEVMILLLGPIVNFCFFVLFFILNFFLNEEIFSQIYLVNLCLFVFNMLPFYNFDGGKIIEVLLKNKFNEKASNMAVTCISFIVLIPFCWFSIKAFLLNNNNFYYLIVSALMLLTIILKK
jgi:stage IV sporulation protein FB